MLAAAGLVGLGLLLLVAGAEALVWGASRLALRARIRPSVVGLTVVAAGTSMPELVVSVQSAMAGTPDLAAGNVVGSNIFNIAAILGITALVRPLITTGQTVRLEWPVMMLASVQLYMLSRDGFLDRMEGAFLLGGLLLFTTYLVWLAMQDLGPSDDDAQAAMGTGGRLGSGWAGVARDGGALVGGAGLLAFGSTTLIRGATGLAAGAGVPDAVIGLTIVAAGTGMPELVTSIVAALRGRDDLALANVVGSNVYNLLGIMGTTSVVATLPIAPVVLSRDLPWMLGISALLLPVMVTDLRVSRLEGGVLLSIFIVYWASIVLG